MPRVLGILLLLSSLSRGPLAASDALWKYDLELLSSPQYVVNNEQLFCDREDRLWARILLNFGENTDAYHARSTHIVIVSEDGGVGWRVARVPWPGRRNDRSALPDGMLVETGTHYWQRYPRSDIPRLEKRGYYVWDLGPAANYCATLSDMWVRRSTDDGKSWNAFPVHRQFGFFSRLAVNSPPRQRLLQDGTIVTFAHGYQPVDRSTESDLGGRNHPFILRSGDAGQNWSMIRMADGAQSPSPRGFNEIYPVVWSDGRIFAMLRTAAGGRSFAVSSPDGGLTWSAPRPTPIYAKHPNPTELADGTLVCSYQRRTAPPFGVRARFTADGGITWSDERILRDDIRIADGLVQPTTVEMSDGTLFTIFTAYRVTDGGSRQSFIGGTRWTRKRQPIDGLRSKRQAIRRRGSWSPVFPLPPLKPRHNGGQADQSPWQDRPLPAP